MLGLTKSYAGAFAPTVRVNAFGPGFVWPFGWVCHAVWAPEVRDFLTSPLTSGHIQRPDDYERSVQVTMKQPSK
jgi:3-oxoacyl-[acyl-carrier protein] reductase